MKYPLVAIVGRPNVGKSTLFNRIAHSHKAITSPESGVTRDRHVEEAEWESRRFLVMDTGGWVPNSEDVFEAAIREQVQFAVEECDVVLFLVDAHTGPTTVDLDIAKMLQRSPRPVLLVVNKVDGPKQDSEPASFYSLGLGEPYPASAAGGRSVGEMLDQLVALLPEAGSSDEITRPRPMVAIIGRPNVGKSSFVNAVVGKPLRIVTEIAGTTRDAIDTVVTFYEQPMTLIDTAGLRRRSKVDEAVEFYTTVRTNRALTECDVAVILTDGRDGIVSQDIHIIQQAVELGKGIIVCINKWDLVQKDPKTADRKLKEMNERYPTISYIPKVFISALDKQRVFKVLEMVFRVHEERQKRISTPELNRWLNNLMDASPPPSIKGRDMRLHYITQPAVDPPLFIFPTRWPELVADSYKRYLEHQLRDQYGFEGVPIRLVFRKENLISARVSSVDVAFPGVDALFSYRVPERLMAGVAPGVRVLAAFGHRRMTGIVVHVHEAANPKATKDIEHVLDARPAFSPALLKFTRWIAEYYLCPWGDVLKAALPAGISLDECKHWVLLPEKGDPMLDAFLGEHPEISKLVEGLRAGPITSERLLKQYGFGPRTAVIKHMQTAGLLAFRPVLKAPKIKSHFDAVLTLSADAKEHFSAEFLAQMRSVHEQHLIKEIHALAAEGILRSDLLKGANSARRTAFSKLLAAGTIESRSEEVTRWDPQTETTPETTEPTLLTSEQDSAVLALAEALSTREFDPFLLYGVTGSGKTQVYIEAIRHTLAMGKTALVLLPEIALTPFVWGRFYRAFGNRVAIQHSALGPSVRFDLWRDIRAGKFPVVVGARSAIFAPLENLGLIVVDEEQESSYKQEEPQPRYHARDAALVRARMEGAVIVLGSATPSVESFHNALTGRYKMLRLPKRVGGAEMPEVRIVARTFKKDTPEDADKEIVEKEKADEPHEPHEPPILTEELIARITATLERKKQILLLQNRRGFSPFLICRGCGNIPMCPECSVSLTYHRKGLALRCHYCDHREPAPEACPKCGKEDWITQGVGTQRLEEEVAKTFQSARILRMDSDTASRRGKHGEMVTSFAAGAYDILVGTQMIAKGLDFPHVELSAIAQADTELFYPDFRASEHGASLVLQVSGRAGRRADTGLVIIQSAVPEHPVLKVAIRGNWEEFVREELAIREKSGFPPFSRLVLLRAISKEESFGIRALLRLRRFLQQGGGVEVLGPAPAIVAKIRGLYRVQMLVRTLRKDDAAGNHLRSAVRLAIAEYKNAGAESAVTIEVDVDPQSVA